MSYQYYKHWRYLPLVRMQKELPDSQRENINNLKSWGTNFKFFHLIYMVV